MNKPKGIMHRIIAAVADKLAQHPSIPPENREAFRATVISVFEAQVCAFIGYDTVRITGWVIAPSERRARHDRIVAALHDGQTSAQIASRELVSVQWVNKLRRTVCADETLAS